jgi:hypothetical protein
MVVQADNTLAAIRTKVRRLTASSSESALSTDDIDQYVNTFYSNDFPYAIKLDQMRSVYSFFTAPNVGKYPLNVNYNQGIRDPVYVDGIQAFFYKDRSQFFNMWPEWPTLNMPITGDGMTQSFSFTIGQIPFLPGEVTLGGTDISGSPIQVGDDGYGNLLLNVPNPVVSVPPALTNVPGMKNLNTGNPGDNVQTVIGTVNYVTGAFSVNFALGGVTPIAGQQMNLFVSQYTVGRPWSVLFWNNYFEIRPIPKLVHKIEVETYLTPVQFLQTTDSPILNQWWQYIAIGSSLKILQDRQDMEGVKNLALLFDQQEALVLERQGVEEVGQRNNTIFSATQQNQGWNQFWGGGWF